MYQFDFVCTDEETYELIISVIAKDYRQAIDKLRALKLPEFDLLEWQLEGVYEVGSIIPNAN